MILWKSVGEILLSWTFVGKIWWNIWSSRIRTGYKWNMIPFTEWKMNCCLSICFNQNCLPHRYWRVDWMLGCCCLVFVCFLWLLTFYHGTSALNYHLWNMCFMFLPITLSNSTLACCPMLARSSYMLTGFFGSFDAVFFLVLFATFSGVIFSRWWQPQIFLIFILIWGRFPFWLQ